MNRLIVDNRDLTQRVAFLEAELVALKSEVARSTKLNLPPQLGQPPCVLDADIVADSVPPSRKVKGNVAVLVAGFYNGTVLVSTLNPLRVTRSTAASNSAAVSITYHYDEIVTSVIITEEGEGLSGNPGDSLDFLTHSMERTYYQAVSGRAVPFPIEKSHVFDYLGLYQYQIFTSRGRGRLGGSLLLTNGTFFKWNGGSWESMNGEHVNMWNSALALDLDNNVCAVSNGTYYSSTIPTTGIATSRGVSFSLPSSTGASSLAIHGDWVVAVTKTLQTDADDARIRFFSFDSNNEFASFPLSTSMIYDSVLDMYRLALWGSHTVFAQSHFNVVLYTYAEGLWSETRNLYFSVPDDVVARIDQTHAPGYPNVAISNHLIVAAGVGVVMPRRGWQETPYALVWRYDGAQSSWNFDALVHPVHAENYTAEMPKAFIDPTRTNQFILNVPGFRWGQAIRSAPGAAWAFVRDEVTGEWGGCAYTD